MSSLSQTSAEGERVEHISETLHLFTRNHFRFGTDAVLLAHFTAPRSGDTVWDLGSGCGILPFLLDHHFRPASIVSLDIQPEATALFCRSLEISRPKASLIPLCKDLRTLDANSAVLPAHLVTANPPYFLLGSGKQNRSTEDITARHEETASFEDFARAASLLLRYGGRFCFCMKPARLAEITVTLHAHGLEPKRLQMVSKNADTPPWLFLMEAKKGGHSGIHVERNLYLQNGDGTPSAPYQAIYTS